MKRLQRILAIVISLCIINATMIQTVHAGMISTEEVARLSSNNQAESGHARLATALARADVRAEMERLGVSPTAAAQRIAALTDTEAGNLADKINSAPAGASDVLGAIVFIFVLLIVTDILGFTKIFPFTRSVR
jgi:hypothetical protein